MAGRRRSPAASRPQGPPPLIAAGPDSHAPAGGGGSGFLGLLANARVLRFAVISGAAFGLAIVLSNWVVTLLVRRGEFSEEAAGLVEG